jgi:hypothetical protein
MGNKIYWVIAAVAFGAVCSAFYYWICRPRRWRWVKLGVWWICYVVALRVVYHFVAKIFYY